MYLPPETWETTAAGVGVVAGAAAKMAVVAAGTAEEAGRCKTTFGGARSAQLQRLDLPFTSAPLWYAFAGEGHLEGVERRCFLCQL
jgi:hypothetical protein